MQITVVGAGIMGLGIAWAAARAGHSVTVIEQGAIPNEAGSSVDESRLIRHTYGELSGYGAMVDQAYAAWDRVWADLGVSHYRETGTLSFAEEGDDWLAQSADELQVLGQPLSLLDGEEVSARFPVLDIPSGMRAVYVPTGGVLQARSIVLDLARWVAKAGVNLRTDTKVEHVDPESATCHLVEGGTVHADRLCVAAGPWTNDLLETAAPLTLSRQVSVFAKVPSVFAAQWAEMPVVFDGSQKRFRYVVPPVASDTIKISDHLQRQDGHPDEDRLVARDDAASQFMDCAAHLRSADLYEVGSARSCFYTLTEDERFIVQALTDRTWLLAGFSGHGFKFGPLIGEKVVAVLDGQETNEAVTAFAAGR